MPAPEFDRSALPPVDARPAILGWKDQDVLDASVRGRAQPGEWVWVSSALPDLRADDQFVREIVRGDRAVLGGRAERWNAVVVPMASRDGRWVRVDDAARMAPGEWVEDVVAHRFIAYLGPREEVTPA